MKKIIYKLLITVFTLLLITQKTDAQLLSAGDAVVTFNDQIYNYTFAPHANPSNAVMQILKTGNTASALPYMGTVGNAAFSPWSSFMYFDPRWTSANLGLIFGITLDNSKNIFVTSTGFFGNQPAGKTTGGIYKIDGITGTPLLVKDLNPGGLVTDLSLGNIKFFNGFLYVTNIKDGKIYSINATTYATVATYTPTGWSSNDKPCGLAIRNVAGTPKLFFSRNGFSALTTSVYSIGINPSGNFIGTQNLEIPIASLTDNDNPITDIAFSKDGSQIILAQKSDNMHIWNFGLYPSANHNSTVIKHKWNGTNWINANANFEVGTFSVKRNCAGGLDFSDFQINQNKITFCDTTIYATADAIFRGNSTAPEAGYYCYGMTGFNNQTNAGSSTGINIDFNNISDGMYKGHYGDVEILDTTITCPLVGCQCPQDPKPVLISIVPNFNITSVDLKCGETYTDRLECFKEYFIGLNAPCGEKCEPDSVITTIQPPVGSTLISYSSAFPTFTANQVGTYIVTIKYKCNGKWCEPCVIKFKQTKACDPPCNNCKDKVQADFDDASSTSVIKNYPSPTTLNTFINLAGGADTYTQVRVNVVDFQITSDNPACLQCYNNPSQWGGITGGSLAGFAGAVSSYPSVSPFNGSNNPREIIFTAPTPTTIPTVTALNLGFTIPGTNPLSCCCIKVVLFVKITYRNNKCEECSKIVRIGFKQCPTDGNNANGTPIGGTGTFDQTPGWPQFRQMHAPSNEDAQLLKKNPASSYDLINNKK